MRPCLLTAGATRNPVDSIRYLSASATGRTGVRLAQELARRGVSVRLLGSPEALLRAGASEGIEHEAYGSTRDLFARMEHHVRLHPLGAVVHSAAVGDYEADPDVGKLPSGMEALTLTLRPAPKILDSIRSWGHEGPLVSFKAAAPETTDDDLVAIARAQLRRTASDRVFANVIGRTSSGVFLVSEHDAIRFADRSDALAHLEAWLYERLA